MNDEPPPTPPGIQIPPPPPPPGFDREEDESTEAELVSNEEIKSQNSPAVVPAEINIPAPPPPPGFEEQPVASPPPPPPLGLDNLNLNQEMISGGESIEAESLPTENYEINVSDSLTVLDTTPGDESDWEESSDIEESLNAISGLESQPVSSQPSSLRPVIEVDSIPGDKLHATLSEVEQCAVNPDGSIRNQTIEGELILRNSSRKDRAWDIEVSLNEFEYTDIDSKMITVRELEATEETVVPYTASGPRMMVLSERVDTNSERGQEASLSLVHSEDPQEIGITIVVENVSTVNLSGVEITRSFPINFEIPEGPEYSVEGTDITWSVGRLSVGQRQTLELLPMVTTQGIGKIAAGKVTATYSADHTVSRVDFENISARSRAAPFVTPTEDDRPGIWHSKFVFENKSSFVVTLSDITVILAGRDEPILDSSDLRVVLPPEGSWDSMVKTVKSEDQPRFTFPTLSYSILPRASSESRGEISVKEQFLTVLDAEILKKFDRSRIRTYVSSDIEATITVENKGSAAINVMRLLDDIPGIFEPPSPDSLSIEIGNSELNEDQYRVEVVSGTQLEEKMVSPDGQGHALRITVGTSAPLGLQPGKKLVIRYSLNAKEPSKDNGTLAAPARADFSSERFGPVATRNVKRPPQIKVVHKRRSFTTGKEVYPAGGPGRYEILLVFQNNSDSALEDLALHDVVPGTFSLDNSSVKSSISGEIDSSYTKEPAREGTHITWSVGRIELGERITVQYEIQGDPESEYKVSDAQDYHGATFGEEVDEEPNLPEWVDVDAEHDDSDISLPEPEPESDPEPELDPEPEPDREPEPDPGPESDPEPEVPNEEIQSSCPICGTESSVGSSSCGVCGYSFIS